MLQDIYLFGISTTSIRIKSFIDYHQLYNVKAFIVDDNFKSKDKFEGLKVFTMSDFRTLDGYSKLPVFICVAWNNLNNDRRIVYNKLKNELNIINLISPSAVIRGSVKGYGNFIGDFVVLETNCIVDSNCYIDHHSFVGTNTIIASSVYIGAKAMVAGGVHVNEQSFIGINATVFDEVIIGKKCIISGAQAISRNVNDFSVVKIKNGQQITQTYSEEMIIYKLRSDRNVR